MTPTGGQGDSFRLQRSHGITGFVDGAQVVTATNSLHSHGMTGLVTCDNKTRNTACFDSLLINAVGAATPKPTVFANDQTPIYKQ